MPDEFGARRRRWRFTRRDADGASERVELPARTVLVAAGTAQRHLREGAPRHVRSSTAGRSSSRASARSKDGDGRFALEPDANGFFTSYEQDGRFVTFYGDNHPRYAGNVVKAMASAKHGYPHVVALFEDEIAGARSGGAAGARSAAGDDDRRGSTTQLLRDVSSASCG